MGKKGADFIIETNGQCFLCSNYITHPKPLDKLERKSLNESSHVPNHSKSIQCLSRYLNIDMSKVFIGDGPISPHLLAKVRNSKLQVDLCEECVKINDKFSELSLQLEKTKLEMNSWLQLILVKLNKDGETDRNDELQSMTELQKTFLKRKRQIVEVMRKEAMQKCSIKLSKLLPRVCINRLTRKQENDIKLKVQRNRRQKNALSKVRRSQTLQIDVPNDSTSDPHPNIKLEQVTANSSSDSDNGEDSNFDDAPYMPPSPGTSDDDSDGSVDLELGMDQPKRETIDESTAEAEETAPGNNQVHPSIDPPKSSRRSEGSLYQKCIVDPKTNIHTCLDCSQTFKSFAAFYHHYRVEHLKTIFTCSICNRTFKQVGNFNQHQKVAHKGATYKCRDCNQVFSLEFNLLKHRGSNGCMDRDDVEKSNLLILRPKKPSKHSAKIQSMCVLNSKSGKYRCKLCKLELASLDTFRKHYNTVHLKIQYKCIPCNKIFAYRSTYGYHQASVHFHANKCSKCNKHFPLKWRLRQHLATGTCGRGGERVEANFAINPESGMHKCSECEEEFTTRGRVKQHHRISHLKQGIKCKNCPRVFASQAGFYTHNKKVHLKIRETFKCRFCETVFQGRSSRNRHERNFHGTGPTRV